MGNRGSAPVVSLPPDLRVRLPDSELDGLMAACDWASGPLGPPEHWPADLRATAGLCLNSRFPMLLAWGPDLTMIYNDAYAPILGDKHPAALGQPLAGVWADVWPVISDMVAAVVDRGEVVYHEDLPLGMRRHGFDEEAYFTFCYHPVLRADGTVGGVVDTVTETTAQVLSARRLAALQELARIPGARIGGTRAVCESVAEVLSSYRADLPFGAIYLHDEPGVASVAASFGDAGEPGTPPSSWPAAAPEADGRHAVALPLGASGVEPVGTAVLGVSPHLLLDGAYRSFLDLVAAQIASALSDAEAYQAQSRRMQQMAELERARTDFFTGVSHELRTPLALIAGPAADSLADTGEPLGPVHRHRMELVHRNAGRLRRLVDTLLDFARIEDGGLTPEPAVIDPGELTRDIAGSFAPAAYRAGLEFLVDSPDLGAARLDPEMWEKILLNLLSNAVKFTVAGRVTVRLRRAEGALELRVDDSGIGIPGDELGGLFRRFHRVRGTGGRSAEGSGIGLALVSELAALHGGVAEVESEPGRGSTFTVRIPVDEVVAPVRAARPRAVGRFLDEALQWTPLSDEDPGRATARPAEPDDGAYRVPGTDRPTVLLADDNRDMRVYLGGLLAPHYDVVPVADGRAALEQVRHEVPDLVLADVVMPLTGGLELLSALRTDPVTATVPVILLSARTGDAAAVEGLDAGADDYLAKPFSASELLARVRTTLALARARAGESDRLRTLAAATVDAYDAPDTQAAAALVADAARRLAGAQRVVVELRDGAAPRVSASAGDPARPGRGASPDGPADDVRSVPVVSGAGRTIGTLRATATAGRCFSAADRAVLSQLAETLASVAERDRLLREQTTVALTLQRSILGPIRLPPGFSVRYEPAAGTLEVGGDWYDVIDLAGGRLGVVVGDVVGRGLDAAAVMGQLRSAGRALLLEGRGPAQVLATLDGFASLTAGARCSTVFCAVVDPRSGTVRYSSAGHLPAILVEPDGTHRFLDDALAVPLAVLEDVHRPEAVARMGAGSTLLLYTDGLVERRDEEVDHGIDRAVATVVTHRHRSVDDVVEALCDALISDGHDDDVAVLAYRQPDRAGVSRTTTGKSEKRRGCTTTSDEHSTRTSGGRGVDEMTRAYEPVASSCALVRRDVGAFLAAVPFDEETVEAAVMIANELASNAVDHAGTPFRVAIALLGRRLRIEVSDGSRDLPVLQPHDPRAVRGRGLQMVDHLASTWGCELGPDGKTVAADVRPAAVAARGPVG